MRLEKKYYLNEVSIVPAVLSNISSRSDVDITVAFDGRLPWWVAPMDTVVDVTNYELFLSKGANVILPRKEWVKITDPISHKNLWYALTLEEAKDITNETNRDLLKFQDKVFAKNGKIRYLIDVANGHMGNLYEVGAKIKNKYGDEISLMGGNIANPETLIQAQGIFEYMRLGIGGGSRCLTTTKTGIHYPMASLILDSSEVISGMSFAPILIADGGISSIGDAIKAVALGAEPMMGKLFSSTIEACGTTTMGNETLDKETALKLFNIDYKRRNAKFYNLYRGMSTIDRQITEGKSKIRVSEGFTEQNEIKYTLEELMEELNHSLASSMSYCGVDKLKDYMGKQKIILA